MTRQFAVTAGVLAFAAGSVASAVFDVPTGVAFGTPSSSPAAIAEVGAGGENVSHATVTEEQTLESKSVIQKDPTALKGTRKILSQGGDGTQLVTYDVTYVDGVEVSRVESVSVVTSPATNEVIKVGTLVIPATTPAQQGTNRGIGQSMASSMYGWTGDQWACLDTLWMHESGWRHTAQNKSSGAYGIPQALPGSKMAKYGDDWMTNPATQIKWGLAYIKGRYGNPCNGWSHFVTVGWY